MRKIGRGLGGKDKGKGRRVEEVVMKQELRF
jgi:hypothetical protein